MAGREGREEGEKGMHRLVFYSRMWTTIYRLKGVLRLSLTLGEGSGQLGCRITVKPLSKGHLEDIVTFRGVPYLNVDQVSFIEEDQVSFIERFHLYFGGYPFGGSASCYSQHNNWLRLV